MKKSRLIIGSLVGISILLGGISYSVASNIEKDKKELDKLDYILPFTSEFTYDTFDNRNHIFVQCDKEYNSTVIDDKGNPIKTYKNYYAYGGEGLFIYRDNNKYGYKKMDGTLLLKAMYDEASEFSGEYAVVKFQKEGKEAIIDKKGNIVFKGLMGQSISPIDNEHYLLSNYNKKTEIINATTREKLVINKKYNIIWPDNNGNYVAYGDFDDKVYILDKDFVDVTDRLLGDKSSQIKEYNGFDEKYGLTNIGYLDRDYKLVYKKAKGSEICSFNEGKAFVFYDDRIDCIDENFKVLFSIETKYRNEAVYRLTSFNSGIAKIEIDNNKKGYIDEKGKWLVKPILDCAQAVENGIAVVGYKGMSGVICLKNQ